jgi:hypothetical protein
LWSGEAFTRAWTFSFVLISKRDAAARNLSSGMLASRLVRHFVHRAGDSDWQGVGEATRNADMPILSGFRDILERGLELDKDEDAPSFGRLPGAGRRPLL